MAKKDDTLWLIAALGGLFLLMGWSVNNAARSIAQLPLMLAKGIVDGIKHVLNHLVPGGKP